MNAMKMEMAIGIITEAISLSNVQTMTVEINKSSKKMYLEKFSLSFTALPDS